MKKSIALIAFGLIICTAFNKPKTFIVDYRDSYTGTYSGRLYSQTLSSGTMSYTNSSSIVSITISKDATDSVVDISLGSETLKAKLITPGLQPYPLTGFPYIYGGRFFAGATDSLDFFYVPNKARSFRYIGKRTGI